MPLSTSKSIVHGTSLSLMASWLPRTKRTPWTKRPRYAPPQRPMGGCHKGRRALHGHIRFTVAIEHKMHTLRGRISFGVLWHTGVSDGPETKRITMGHIRLAQAANLSDKAVKRCLAQLVEKLAIEVIASEISASRTGRTYRIHSFKSILERRNAAGLLFVVRDKGVRFVPEPTKLASVNDVPQLPSSKDITSTVDKTSPVTGDITSPDATDRTSPATVDKTCPLRKFFSN